MAFIEENYVEDTRTTWEVLDDIAKSPEAKAYARMMARRRKVATILFGWTRRVPLVGSVVWVFWSCLIEEGVVQTMKPRWGALTFSFLNDGMRPTLWHTWRQVTKDHSDPFTGIYVGGAPKSLAQAQEWEAKWERERAQERARAMNSANVLLPLVPPSRR